MSNGYTLITEATIFDYPLGTRLEMNYGCGPTGEDENGNFIPQQEEAVVIGHEVDRWGARLKVLIEGRNVETTVNGISTVGIGTYLIEKAEAPKANPNSPWAR